jgi:hypothetical protein
MSSSPAWIAVLGSLLVLAQTPARTQEPPAVELSGGYAFLAAPEDSLPRGVFATGGWRAMRRIALVGEFKANVKNADGPDFRSRLRVRTLLGGVRFSVSPGRRLEPFVQGLAGVSIVDVRVRDTGPPTDLFPMFDVQLGSTDVTARLGGGLTWWLSTRVGAQIEVHHQRTFDRFDLGPRWPGRGVNEFGVLAGAVVGFGRKS